MNLHLSKMDIYRMILDKYDIRYDEVKDTDGVTVSVVLLDKDKVVTWAGSGFEVEGKE